LISSLSLEDTNQFSIFFKEPVKHVVFIKINRDRSDIYRQRLQLLLKNAFFGLLIVLLLLGLSLEFRLAVWVMMGIPISFLGALLFLPGLDVSINMISAFAFIVALGIVVDDTIVVGENVYNCNTNKNEEIKWRQRDQA